MRFEAIIFNFDGVIANSKRLSTQALIESMAEAGMPTSLDDALRDFSSKRWSDVLVLLEARMGSEIPESLISQQYKRMSRRVILEVGTVPGIEAFLDLTSGVPRAIAGSSEPIWISQTLARFGLEHHFGAHVYTTATLAHDKPDPEIYALALRRFGLQPGEAIFIDDNLDNVVSARENGFAAHHFVDAGTLRTQLAELELLNG